MGFLPNAGALYCRMQPKVLTSAALVTTLCYRLTISSLSARYILRGIIQPDELIRIEAQLGDAL
jgi:hypothetical protein